MALLVISYAMLDYERYEKSSSVKLRCLVGLICPEDDLKRLLHGGHSWGRDAHALPRNPATNLHGGRDGRAAGSLFTQLCCYSASSFLSILLASGSLISLCLGMASTTPIFGLTHSECDRPSLFR